jgi:uncharacterized protein (DUF305 family)
MHMSSTRWFRTIVGVLAAAVVGAAIAIALLWAHRGASPSFRAESDVAMRRMVSAMTITSSGDADRDFVAMMVPHHQAAIEMARAELRYGHNELLRRMAQEIIVGQSQEIVAMRLVLGQPGADK